MKHKIAEHPNKYKSENVSRILTNNDMVIQSHKEIDILKGRVSRLKYEKNVLELQRKEQKKITNRIIILNAILFVIFVAERFVL